MPQQTNLNVAPYFDDFDANSDYHQVLFKPGYPIQARELNNLQSILQNQIEKFGQHFFKEGAKVIPGNIGYNPKYNGIQLNNQFKGVPVSAYIDQLIGAKITGLQSGVSAIVGEVLLPEDSERDTLTLYCNYISSNTTDNNTETFSDAEELTCNVDIISGLLSNTTIKAGSPFATTVSTEAAIIGTSFQIEEGVYFIRGHFVLVNKETLILDQYGYLPTYKIGFYVDEQIITADQDETLNDNSQGFNNYAAPGANRLKISVSLFKKSITDLDGTNFIELAEVVNGILRAVNRKGFGEGSFDYDVVDTLTRRTYDESGHYYVKPFGVSVENSLNDNFGNRGIFQADQFTYGGSIPSNDLALYKVSPGKAYVKGYEVETVNTVWIDADKPRTSKLLKDQSFIYNTGLTLDLNRNYRTPTIGIGNTYYVSLRDERVGDDQEVAPGNEIGVARVYDFKLESGSYDAANGNVNEWNLALYDVQTNVEIAVNQSTTLSVPTFVKGANSGATGFLRHAVSAGTAVTVYETEGSFVPFEKLIFNGIEGGRVAIAITEHGIADVKSVYGMDGYDGTSTTVGINTFSADVIQSTKFSAGIATVSALSGGISTITAKKTAFPGTLVKENDLIEYTDTTAGLRNDPIVARVVGVATTTITVAAVEDVVGVASAFLPAATLDVTDLKVLKTDLASISDSSLYTPLAKRNVSNVDISEATLVIRKTFSVDIASNQLSSQVVAGTNETFLQFDEERYLLTRSDGSTEVLTADKFDVGADGKTLQIRNLSTDDTGATLVATLNKTSPKAKVKIKNRVNSIIVDKSKLAGSGIGSTTLNNGLTSGNYPFGTRVEDEIVSLNFPDIIEIHGIYESADTSAASAPNMTLQSINSASTTTTELLIGEQIVGQTSGARAIVSEKLNDSTITFIRKTETVFVEGETIEAQESNIGAIISSIGTPSFNISANYKFKTGQEETFYDHGRLKRKKEKSSPAKQLKIYFSSAFFDSTDTGDVVTVNSYNNFDYADEIRVVEAYRNSDIIDIRPRVAEYTVDVDVRSPLEFFGRSFNTSGQTAANTLASDESIILDYSYYQGRIDRVYLSKDGRFQIIYGTPSDDPQRPEPIDDAIELCTVSLPPYLYAPSDAKLAFLDYKRYQMKDIKKLEDRIKSLEYYTTLSLLEKETANFFVPDAEGLNRFKSGFFVDNFNDFSAQEDRIDINNAIDRKYNELRPRHYTNAVDMIFGPVVDTDASDDVNFAAIEGNNVRKENDVLTLDYSEVEYISQTFATRTESVTPFLISFWNGTLELTPASDNWVDTARLQAKIIDVEGDYASTFNRLADNGTIDPQTGFGPMVWDSWETNWTGVEVVDATRTRVINNGPDVIHQGESWRPGTRTEVRTVTDQVIEEQLRTTREFGTVSRSGVRTIVTEQFDQESVGDRTVSRDLIPFMRSRNVEFVAKKVKPLTRLYAFFDGVDISKYCVPKLLEITMFSGTFQVGETVSGTSGVIAGLIDQFRPDAQPAIKFRVAQSNHREGPYDSPTKTYPQNPYSNIDLASTYSSTATILNVDTASLSSEVRGDFFGYTEAGMTLVGETSGAFAQVTNVRLVSDLSSTLIGSYFVPNGNNINHPRFECGTKTFTLVNDIDNNQDDATTIAEESFSAEGTLETVQENIVSVRNARVELKNEFQSRNVNRDLGTEVVSSEVIGSRTRTQTIISYYDPLAQSFLVEDETGVFLTSCDVFFRSKDDMDIPVVFQLRSMKNGLPTSKVLPFSEIVLDPGDVITSADGSIATNVQFKAPVYLEGGTEYAICLASNSTKYSVYISRIGENDLLTDTFISNQPYLGSLFKSQNASTWEPSQWEDLKFTLYRADFIENGSVEFYSPELTEGNRQIPNLLPDPINLNSRQIRVGLGTTVADSGYEIGNTFYQLGTNATGDLVGTAGSATGNLSITNAGLGLTPADGSFTFAGVNLVTITGNGRGATAEVSVNNGSIVASGATITTGGSGYQIGDVLGITTIGIASMGRNVRLTVAGIGITNEIILNNVQGEFVVGAAKTLGYFTSAGAATTLNNDLPGAPGGDVQISSINVDNDGMHFTVDHKNHGMYFSDNQVKISGVRGDVKPTKLTVELPLGSTDGVTVSSASSFTTFENVGVGTTNVGYLQIGDEIITYTQVAGNTLSGTITRGANPRTYPAGTPVHKYELGGVNLQRINRTHDLSDVTQTDPFTFDSYKVKLDMSSTTGTDRSTDVGYPKLYMGATRSAGGYGVKATQNMPFEIITPNVQNLTVSGTSISAEVRTVSSKSFSGNEIPYVDKGFEDITINKKNYFDSPRMIASKVNEDANLTTIEGNKSMNMRLFLTSTDTRISPVIDSQRVSAILTSNRVNNIITDYATDSRVDTVDEDPTGCQYISKEIVLENPASSLKIILAGHFTDVNDIRSFYCVSNKPGLEPIFTPFPGYTNLNSRGQIIAPENSNGEPDAFVLKSNTYGYDSRDLDYREYTFTIDQLPSFRTYRVKLNLTSTSQCFVPRVKELRVIALA